MRYTFARQSERRPTRRDATTRLLIASALLLLQSPIAAAQERPPVNPATRAPLSVPREPLQLFEPGTAPDSLERVSINDNRRAAGTLADGVLTLRLEARQGLWFPEDTSGVALAVAAFAEEEKALQNPGPVIRVPAGTEVHVTVRNSLGKTLTLFGLGERRGISGDSVTIAPGASRHVCFTARNPGVYYYAGKTSARSVIGRGTEDSQLNGVIVVDPPRDPSATAEESAGRQPNDRVFLIGWWFTLDSASVSGLGRTTLVINGKSWPHTERLDVAQRDSLTWRWINLTGLDHPMHLHGFYFTVDGTGDGARYTHHAVQERRRAVTEVVAPGATLTLTWSPERPGNWIVHCHAVAHLSHHVALSTINGIPTAHPQTGAREDAHAGHHAMPDHVMNGLVLGVRVAPRGVPVSDARPHRRLRLIVRSRPNVYGDQPGYAYVLGGTPEEADTVAFPARNPTLVLRKGEPVAITVINQSSEPAAVHWHGIELDSYADGVPGWSGSGASILPMIPPRDSLTVRFTPPRAGTFMYHSHSNELQQISSGLYGAIVVLDKGASLDPETDRILLVSDAGPTLNVVRGPHAPALLNGQLEPAPMRLRQGVTYRLRLINIRTDFAHTVTLLDGATPARWRPVAKDGADLPAVHAVEGPAQLTFAPGEIHDVEFTPRAAGELVLQFAVWDRGPRGQPTLRMPLSVRK